MSQTIKYETTTSEGNKIRIEGPEVPPATEILQSGQIPSNKDIQEGLDKAKANIQEAAFEAPLDRQGKKLEKDLEGVIDSTRKLVLEKNPDEQLQEMLKETKKAMEFGTVETSQMKGQLGSAKLQPEVQSMMKDAKELYSYIRSLSWDFVRSGEFRDLLADWIQYLFSMAISKTKEEAIKQEGETQVGQAIAQGLQEPVSPLPKEELQEETEDKLFQLLSKISSKSEYEDFFINLLRLFDVVNEHLIALNENKPINEHLQKALQDGRDFISKFTGEIELEEFINLSRKFYYDVSEDEELGDWFFDVRIFMQSTFEEPELLKEQERKDRARQLTERGRLILQKEKWRNDLTLLREKLRMLLESIRNDSTSQEWSSKLEKLGNDMLFNAQGQPDLFVLENSLYQLKNLVIPLFKKTLENIPINRIDVNTDTYDVRVEDLLFDATTFTPEHLDFKLLNLSHMDFKDERKDVVRHQMQLRVDQIKPVFKNLKFYYRRKSFPKIEDYGVADLALTGDGGTINVIWTVESQGGKQPVAILSLVECTIDKLSIHIVGEATKHDWLDTILAPLISSRIKNSVASTLQDYFRNKLEDVNSQLNDWFSSRPWYQLKLKADQKLKESYQTYQQEQPRLSAK